VTDDGIVARCREHSPQRPPRPPDRGGTAESNAAEHSRITAAFPQLASDSPVEAKGEIVRTLVGPLCLGNREQHPLDAAEQVAGGHVEHTKWAIGRLLHRATVYRIRCGTLIVSFG
jgi:hypothetical protein